MLIAAHDRLRHLDQGIVDATLAFAVLVALELTVWLSSGVSESDRVVTAAASVLFAAPIALRRVWPGAAVVFAAGVVTVSMLFGGQLLSNDNAYVIPVVLLSYSAGVGLDARRSCVAVILALVLLFAWALVPGPDGSGTNATAVYFVTMLVVPIWLVGRLVRRHGRRASAFRELAVRASAEQQARAAAAIADERARIGSELQDIIAHSISAMVIQAGSARLVLRDSPERARESILNVEQTGRQALGDLRRLLGMLRKDDDPRALSPQPGLSQLPALIEAVKRKGLTCERSTVGDPIHLTPGIDLVAYRVLETALRAAADHGAGRGVVTICYEPRALRLEVRGDRAIPDLEQTLMPLSQRVELYHGDLGAQPTPHSFAVSARLPIDVGAPA